MPWVQMLVGTRPQLPPIDAKTTMPFPRSDFYKVTPETVFYRAASRLWKSSKDDPYFGAFTPSFFRRRRTPDETNRLEALISALHDLTRTEKDSEMSRRAREQMQKDIDLLKSLRGLDWTKTSEAVTREGMEGLIQHYDLSDCGTRMIDISVNLEFVSWIAQQVYLGIIPTPLMYRDLCPKLPKHFTGEAPVYFYQRYVPKSRSDRQVEGRAVLGWYPSGSFFGFKAGNREKFERASYVYAFNARLDHVYDYRDLAQLEASRPERQGALGIFGLGQPRQSGDSRPLIAGNDQGAIVFNLRLYALQPGLTGSRWLRVNLAVWRTGDFDRHLRELFIDEELVIRPQEEAPLSDSEVMGKDLPTNVFYFPPENRLLTGRLLKAVAMAGADHGGA